MLDTVRRVNCCETCCDASLAQRIPTVAEVVSLVSVQLLGALAGSATGLADRCNGVHGLLQDFRVVDVGGGVDHRERHASSVDHDVALRAPFFLVRRVRIGLSFLL
jgi:hypothetical protein